MRTIHFLWLPVLGLAQTGCTGDVFIATTFDGGNDAASGQDGATTDGGGGGEQDASTDASPPDSARCTTSSECASGQICGFLETPACPSSGTCFTVPTVACLAYSPGCACDGTEIRSRVHGTAGRLLDQAALPHRFVHRRRPSSRSRRDRAVHDGHGLRVGRAVRLSDGRCVHGARAVLQVVGGDLQLDPARMRLRWDADQPGVQRPPERVRTKAVSPLWNVRCGRRIESAYAPPQPPPRAPRAQRITTIDDDVTVPTSTLTVPAA